MYLRSTIVDLYSIGFSQESTAPVLQPITNVLILPIFVGLGGYQRFFGGLRGGLSVGDSHFDLPQQSPCLSSNAATLSAISKVAQGRATLSPRFDRADGRPDKSEIHGA
jgi:hypothetical protein